VHKCDAATNGHYPNCDHWGYYTKIWEQDKTAYGPGPQYKINSLNKIHTKFEYILTGDKLTEIHTTLSQDAASYEIVHTDKDPKHLAYLDAVESVIKAGLTLSFSNWGRTGGMKWLDAETGCTEDCENPTMYISNISVVTGPDAKQPVTGALVDTADKTDFMAKWQDVQKTIEAEAILELKA